MAVMQSCSYRGLRGLSSPQWRRTNKFEPDGTENAVSHSVDTRIAAEVCRWAPGRLSISRDPPAEEAMSSVQEDMEQKMDGFFVTLSKTLCSISSSSTFAHLHSDRSSSDHGIYDQGSCCRGQRRNRRREGLTREVAAHISAISLQQSSSVSQSHL
ncbi:hypothetical protein BJY04DRAFT_150724 [Aspergillus karnatakaensis]|uniref:uncharacterized protein n=1 Tax=Aspergillus karnatakaensis TaxID=1810916 RepID=UPI003CCD4448